MKAKCLGVLTLVLALLVIALPRVTFGSQEMPETPSLEDCYWFKFEILHARTFYDYERGCVVLVVRVTEVHGDPNVKVGDIYRLTYPPDTLKIGEYLGWWENTGPHRDVFPGCHVCKVEVPEVPTQTEWPMSGTVDPRWVNKERGIYHLFYSQLVEIERHWTPASQPIMLGLLDWTDLNDPTFHYQYRYGGHGKVSMRPDWRTEGDYNIGVGNPQWNEDPIYYEGQYTIYPAANN